MDEEIKKQIAELNLRQMVQLFALQQIIAVLNDKHPELKINEAFESLYAETFLHFAEGLQGDLAQRAEDYFSNLIKPPSR